MGLKEWCLKRDCGDKVLKHTFKVTCCWSNIEESIEREGQRKIGKGCKNVCKEWIINRAGGCLYYYTSAGGGSYNSSRVILAIMSDKIIIIYH